MNVDEMWTALKEDRKRPEEVNWETEKSEDEVSEFLIRWCVRHFGQSMDTPLAGKEWKQRLDPRYKENQLEAVMNGKFKLPPGVPIEFEEFMKAARRPSGVTNLKAEIKFEHFKSFCEKQDERKVSSPSGLHYGHLKALTWNE